MTRKWLCSYTLVGFFTLVHAVAFAQNTHSVVSHPPIRPLPTAATRPLATGPSYYVDPNRGADRNNGSLRRPWKTLAHAVTKLRPGDTLYLRGGTYYEHVTIKCQGTKTNPITIRAYPGEHAIVDGGVRDFFESSQTAWQPFADGATGEFRSTKKYPDLGSRSEVPNLLGQFGDSMVPLHGYRFLRDFRSDDMYWRADIRTNKKKGVWCGPGLWYDAKTGYIHVRLAHTTLPGLGKDNYRGVTDPRKVPLIVAGFRDGSPLTLRQAKHVRAFDLVVRGSREATIDIDDCENLLFDGLTVYGGAAAFRVRNTWGLRVINTACRGIAAPWTFRSSLKYRALEARIFSASGWQVNAKGNRDFELAYSEFTDCVDGVFLGNVRGTRFHHNLVDNVSDDALFLTATTAYDGTTPGGGHHIYQNLLSRSLTMFAFGAGHGRQKALKTGRQTGAGAYIYRNIIDFRGPAMYFQPRGPDAPQELTSRGRFASDHGGPTWEPMWIYHNTILADQQRGYAYGALGLADHMSKGARRRVFNNIVVQMQKPISLYLPPATSDFQADGNLLWSMKAGAKTTGNSAVRKRFEQTVAASKKKYAPGWTTHDQFAAPKFVRFVEDWRQPPQLVLTKSSPAINAGVTLPKIWPDTVRQKDAGQPDQGALPFNVAPWHVGVHGRLTMFGEVKAAADINHTPAPFANHPVRKPWRNKSVALIKGYPAFDAPLWQYALEKQNIPVEIFEKTWLDTKRYDDYSTVIIIGGLARARMTTTRFSKTDLQHVQKFLERGGTFVMQRASREVFASPHGQQFLAQHIGTCPPFRSQPLRLVSPKHPWLRHLSANVDYPWVVSKAQTPLRTSKGQVILGTADGHATLYRVGVAKGQQVYLGWDITAATPRRDVNTVAQEQAFEQQSRIVFHIVSTIVKGSGNVYLHPLR